MCERVARSGGAGNHLGGDMVRQQALRKSGGNIPVSPEEPTISATVEYPFLREFPEGSSNALFAEPDAIRGAAAGRAAGAVQTPTAGSAPPIEPRRAAELLALAARAAWTRGDAPALTRAGRHLFRLACSGAALPVAEDPALWLPPRLVPELLGEDFISFRSCAGMLERLPAGEPGPAPPRA